MTAPPDRLTAALAGRYRVERELGQGGMAMVYLADDLRHDRKVALKVLRPELAAVIGADRFLKEIKVTASLQHPHILPLHDSGEADSFLFYVMPYVEGESLRDRLDREAQLAVDDAVAITRAVASALDYAHRHGVIHRDIKPENVLLHDGNPMVADFGIALAVSHAGGTRLTETGLSLGTPHYMSPEQAMGDRALDARSDVYSLGALLYEMLAGEPPFTGPTAQAIVAKVITEKPRLLSTLRDTVPRHVALAVHKALNKLPADRYPSAVSFGEALVRPVTADTDAYPMPPGDTIAAPVRRFTPATLLFATLFLLAAALALWGWLRPHAAAPTTRHRVTLGALGSIPTGLMIGTAIAPDGSAIVWVDTVGGAPRLWMKERGRYDAFPLPGTTGITGGVTFSPDGAWLAFTAQSQLRKVARQGGAAVTLSDSAGMGRPAWLDDGTIIFPSAGATGVRRVAAAGGADTLIPVGSGDRNVVRVAPLPRPDAVLLTSITSALADSDVRVLDLESGETRVLVAGAGWGAYAPTGHLVYALRDGGVWAARFDLDDFSLGQAAPVDDGVRTVLGMAEAELGADGTFLYAHGRDMLGGARLVWVDRNGRETPVDSAFALSSVPLIGGLRLSPDGSRLAITLPGPSGEAQTIEVFVKRLPGGPAARITFDGTANRRPSWSPDGTQLAFISNRGGSGEDVWAQRADGGGAATLLLDRDRSIFEAEWSPDGRWLVYRTDDDRGAGRGDILAVRTTGDTTDVPLVATAAEETSPAVSPDSRWLAYASDETGRKEIYVRPFPNTDDGKWLVSTGGGIEPAWARSGRELFYRDTQGGLIAASFTAAGGTFEVTRRTTLFRAAAYLGNDDHRFYDVAPDDQRFIMVAFGPGSEAGSALVMVTNFFDVLRTVR